MVEIQIPADQPKSATGRIVKADKATKHGYHKGEEIIKLEANDFGNWQGTVKWRSVLGVHRLDPVCYVLQDGILRAPMASRDFWELEAARKSVFRAPMASRDFWSLRRQ